MWYNEWFGDWYGDDDDDDEEEDKEDASPLLLRVPYGYYPKISDSRKRINERIKQEDDEILAVIMTYIECEN